MELSLDFSSLSLYLFSYLCCSDLDGEQISRPCPYFILDALFLSPYRAMLAGVWLRVTVLDERRKKVQVTGCFLSFLFLLSPHPSPANVFLHTNWETARLCSADFAEETGCSEVANRAVAARRQCAM